MAAIIDLSDVRDPTISMLWKRIYSYADGQQVGQGMAVCRAFRQMLVRSSAAVADIFAVVCQIVY
jgi:hypothetical protein